MHITNHILEGVQYTPAMKIGAVIEPKFIVEHYTAGYTGKSAIDTFRNTEIAAHIVIDRDGTVTQMVPFNRRANHAGPSAWMGIEMLNNHSIGIEFVNIGYAKMRADGRLVNAYNKVIPADEAATYIEAPNSRVGSGRIFWEPYTEAQIAAGIEVNKAIIAHYKIRDIVSHEQIDTRGWKTDPGPAFPMNRFVGLLRGDTSPIGEKPATGMVGVVNTSSLNIRGGAGTKFPVVGTTSKGSRLGIIEFVDGWYRVHTSVNGVEGSGWVLASYVTVA